MRAGWRTFWFVVLALLFVVGVDQASVSSVDRQHSAQTKKDNRKPEAKGPTLRNEKPGSSVRHVPLYAMGDLFVRKPPKPKKVKVRVKKDRPQKRVKTKVPKKSKSQTTTLAKVSPLSSSSRKLNGDRPVLEVAYDSIGFSRYLDVIERVGRLFVLIETKAGTRLGPEISLKRGILYDRKRDMSMLATKRPHLINDERIRNRLAMINIPENAFNDSVVLILTKPFDDLLWDTIAETLGRRKLRLDQVTQIAGIYTGKKNGVFLRLTSTIIKKTGKRVNLKRIMRVSL